METLLKTADREATKGMLSPFCRGVEQSVKQAVNLGSGNNDNSSRLDRPIVSHKFAQKIVDLLLKTTIFTAHINQLVKRYAEKAVMNGEGFMTPI